MTLKELREKEEAAGGSGWDARKKKSEFLQRVSVTIAKGNSRILDCMRHDWQPATAPDLVTSTVHNPRTLAATSDPERAVWLLVGHTHSESPAGVSGLSRLPSPVLSRWVVTIVTGPGTKVRRTFVTATYFNRLLATSTRILATLSCTSSKIAAAISDCRNLDFSSSKIATSSIANCCS